MTIHITYIWTTRTLCCTFQNKSKWSDVEGQRLKLELPVLLVGSGNVRFLVLQVVLQPWRTPHHLPERIRVQLHGPTRKPLPRHSPEPLPFPLRQVHGAPPLPGPLLWTPGPELGSRSDHPEVVQPQPPLGTEGGPFRYEERQCTDQIPLSLAFTPRLPLPLPGAQRAPAGPAAVEAAAPQPVE